MGLGIAGSPRQLQDVDLPRHALHVGHVLGADSDSAPKPDFRVLRTRIGACWAKALGVHREKPRSGLFQVYIQVQRKQYSNVARCASFLGATPFWLVRRSTRKTWKYPGFDCTCAPVMVLLQPLNHRSSAKPSTMLGKEVVHSNARTISPRGLTKYTMRTTR